MCHLSDYSNKHFHLFFKVLRNLRDYHYLTLMFCYLSNVNVFNVHVNVLLSNLNVNVLDIFKLRKIYLTFANFLDQMLVLTQGAITLFSIFFSSAYYNEED